MATSLSVTNNAKGSNCTITPAKTSYTLSSNRISTGMVQINVKADDGYYFPYLSQAITDLTATINYGSGDVTVSTSADNYTDTTNYTSFYLRYPSSSISTGAIRDYATFILRGTVTATSIETETYSSVNVTYTNNIENTSFTAPTETIETGKSYSFTIEPNTHYSIESATISVNDGNGDSLYTETNTTGVFTFSRASDFDTENITITFTGTTVVTTSYETVSVTYVNNIDHTTRNEYDSFTVGNSYNLYVEPQTRYKIDSATITITDSSDEVLYTETNTTGNFTYTPSSSFYGDSVTVTYTGATSVIELEEIPLTVIDNLNNSTLSPSLSSLSVNQEYTFTIKCNDGYNFTYAPNYTLKGYPVDGTAVTIYDNLDATKIDNTEYTFTIPANTILSTYSYVELTVGSITYTVTRPATIYNELSHISYSPVLEKTVSILSAYTLTFTADDGYYITTLPSVNIFSAMTGDFGTFQATIVDDYTATLTFDLSTSTWSDSDSFSITIAGTASLETEIANTYPFLQAFRLPTSKVTDLNNVRFVSESVEGDSTSPTVSYNDVDLGTYIIDLFRPFYPVDIGDDENIKLGAVDTEITANVISKRITSLDSNVIQISPIHGNSVDYNSIVKLYVPFYGFVVLDSSVIGHSLQLHYDIENVTGVGTCNILVDGLVNESVQCECKLTFPFDKNTSDSTTISNAISSNSKTNLLPFVTIATNNVFSESFDTTNVTDEMLLLSSISGYCQGDCYNLEIDENYITSNEISSIRQLITEGVII